MIHDKTRPRLPAEPESTEDIEILEVVGVDEDGVPIVGTDPDDVEVVFDESGTIGESEPSTSGELVSRSAEDVDVGVGSLPAESKVLALVGSANRDPKAFAAPRHQGL